MAHSHKHGDFQHSHGERFVSGRSEVRWRIAAAFGVTAGVMVLEFAGGILSNSLALVGDAGHMLTDTLALGMSLAAVILALRPATSKRTYGLHRAEILAALLNGLALVGISAFIFYEAIQRFMEPAHVRGGLMLTIALVGLGANFVGLFVLRGSSHTNLNVRGAFLHMLSDTLSSVGVCVAAVLITVAPAGWNWVRYIDPVVAVVIAGIIMRGALALVFESGNILLEATPRHIDLDDLLAELRSVEGVEAVHDTHLWTITSGVYAFSGHVMISQEALPRGQEVLKEMNDLLKDHFGIEHTTVQMETETGCFFCPARGEK